MKPWVELSPITRISLFTLGSLAVTGSALMVWELYGRHIPDPANNKITAQVTQNTTQSSALPLATPSISPASISAWAVTDEGAAIVSGLAHPNAQIELLIDGAAQAEGRTTASGEFAILADLAPNPSPSLMSLVMILEDGQRIPSPDVIALGPITGPLPVTALIEAASSGPATLASVMITEEGATILTPDAPTRDDNTPSNSATPEAQTPTEISLEAITYPPGGKVQLVGAGEPGSFIRLYLDNQSKSETKVTSDGKWRADLSEITPGLYQLRADQLDTGGQVTSRIETPFLRETQAALAQAAQIQTPQSEATAHPVDRAPAQDAQGEAALDAPLEKAAELAADPIAQPVQIVVQPGHTLWAIAKGNLGEGTFYVQVWQANKERIRNPDLIYPGQIFTIPAH